MSLKCLLGFHRAPDGFEAGQPNADPPFTRNVVVECVRCGDGFEVTATGDATDQ